MSVTTLASIYNHQDFEHYKMSYITQNVGKGNSNILLVEI